jgi:hypothetical protein
MQEYVTLSIDINHDAGALYERLWRPEAFLEWASGLCGANLKREGLKQDGEVWTGEGMEGQLRVRFSGPNDFGVLDHWVAQAGEPENYVPLRVIANGAGATVCLTVFRPPGMADGMFATEAEWVKRDLQALKEWVEG